MAGPAVWGPREWRRLHLAAIRYPHDPGPADAAAARRALHALLVRLPCPACQAHALAYAARRPPDLSGAYAYQLWCWRFHNAVNERLRHRQFALGEYLALYADEIGCAELR